MDLMPRLGAGRADRDRIPPLVVAALLVLAACQPTIQATHAPTRSTPATTAAATAAGSRAPATSASASPTGTPLASTPAVTASSIPVASLDFDVQTYPVPSGARPHDVAPASDGGVWYTGQRNGTLGWLDPATGDVHEVPLGSGAAPHGVVSGPDGAAWVTDQGLDAIVRVTPGDFDVTVFPMPAGARSQAVHTGVFDHDGILWFTGQGGIVARLDPSTGEIHAFDVPRGTGPYGITVTPSNEIYFVSLAASYLGRMDKTTGSVTIIEPPTSNAGTRRVWSDSMGRLWISYWNAGMLAMYDPGQGTWREWDLPGGTNQAYSMYVDDADVVWISDFPQNSILRFDPVAETFLRFESTRSNANVRQMLGRPGEAWGAESGVDRLIVIRYGPR